MMALNFGRLAKIGDNIAKKVMDEILDEGSEIFSTLLEKIKKSDFIDDLVEEVTEAVIEQIILALTGEKVDIEFDDDASTSSMYIPQDEGYFDDGIWIGSKVSIIRATSTNVRFRGIIWGR